VEIESQNPCVGDGQRSGGGLSLNIVLGNGERKGITLFKVIFMSFYMDSLNIKLVLRMCVGQNLKDLANKAAIA